MSETTVFREDPTWFTWYCGECGCQCVVVCQLPNGDDAWRYCPSCGRRIVEFKREEASANE
jgi:uncharacterized paraquat-inducible protein A